MNNTIFAICLSIPFFRKPIIFWGTNSTAWHTWGLGTIDPSVREIVAFGFSEASGEIRKSNIPLRSTVIDIVTGIKLIKGKSKSDIQGKHDPWSIRSIVGEFANNKTKKWLSKIDNLQMETPFEEGELKDIALDLIPAFVKAYERMRQELDAKMESERFFNIEVPIYNIFLQTTSHGISVSRDRLETRIEEIKTSYFRAIKSLEFDFDFHSERLHSELRWEDVSSHLPPTNDARRLEWTGQNFWRFAEFLADSEFPFFKHLVDAHKSQISYKTLLRYTIDLSNKIFPKFDVMGTVTGRILIQNPGIQFLKKSCRDIFSPSEGNSLIYADYSQFEPGIVAHFSQDPALLGIYNSGDVYTALSQALYKDTVHRKLSKIIFLSFLYGMSPENIQSLVMSQNMDNGIEFVTEFFKQFSSLSKWRHNAIHEAQRIGFACSAQGNRRYLSSSLSLSHKEKRWIPNQFIQGTGSLIFKSAILKTKQIHPGIKFLIPMHDGILLEVPSNLKKEIQDEIEKVFLATYLEFCPTIIPKVSFDPFDKD